MTRGMAYYAFDREKAESMLRELGSRNPLFVEALTVRNEKHAVLSNNDVRVIASAIQEENFLKEGRVVFLIG